MPVHRDEKDTAANVQAEVCEACGKAPSECGVWGKKTCYPCAADWGTAAPTYGDIEAKYGTDADTVAIYKAFTERWVAARKARAA